MQTPESALFHRHLILAYAFTWALQLTYLTYVITNYLAAKKSASTPSSKPS